MYKLLLILIVAGMGFYSQNVATVPVSQNPQFNTMDEYVHLLVEPATSTKYYTAKPEGFERIKINGVEKRMTVMFDGVTGSVFVLAAKGWDAGNLEDIQAFYLEVASSADCFGNGEVICSIPQTFEWYGPFTGKLEAMVN